MQLSDILTVERIACDIEVTSKKRVIQQLSELIADSDALLTSRTVVDCLLARERLGSTGLGSGVALPHGRLPNLRQAVGAFMKLKEPVEFDALDGQPVDLVFGLLVPEESTDEHLQILSLLAEGFSEETLRQQLRDAPSNEASYALLAEVMRQA